MTIQILESLRYQDKSYRMNSYPLSKFLIMANINIELPPLSTACWRGYIGDWSIIEDRLYLEHVSGEPFNDKENPLRCLFPEADERVFAHWFTGELNCPLGEPLYKDSPGMLMVYRQQLIIRIWRGQVKETSIIDSELDPVKLAKAESTSHSLDDLIIPAFLRKQAD